jgi:hypothetical protein
MARCLLPLGLKDIDGDVLQARALVGKQDLAECPLNVVRPQPPVTPGEQQVDDLLNRSLNAWAAENPARHRHPVDYSQASEIVEKPEQIAGEEKHLAVVAVSRGVMLLKGLLRRAQDLAPVIMRPTPKRYLPAVHLQDQNGHSSGAGLSRRPDDVHHIVHGLVETLERLTHMLREVPEDTRASCQIEKRRHLLRPKAGGAVIS